MSTARKVMSAVMKAIRVSEFGGEEVLKLQTDVPIPKPQINQVLIKVFTAGVNPVDTYIRSGAYARLPELPYTPGNDCAGIIHAVGDNVKQFTKGQRIYCMRGEGTYGEYTVSDEEFVHPLHDNLSFSQGAALGVAYFTAYRALLIRAAAKPGESVLVHGASGGVGLAACQIGHARGMKVIGTAGSAEGMCIVSRNGASKTFNHKEDGYAEKISEYTDGEGVDVIIEMLANVNLATDLTLLKTNGKVVVVGNRGSIEINPRLTMAKESSIMGCMLWQMSKLESQEIAAQLEVGAEQGWVKPVIGKDFSLDQAQDAHHLVINNKTTTGKIIISMP
ncbi:unnamed protein product [Owenia fusiformis]|uniref:Uncharacterized protein n=1 Tax=Owenia fusiformis TaxID=6347 RepID=A0A8J1Y2F4_OWEFU|nr:unnamed protein product [Owenia fusiformis]